MKVGDFVIDKDREYDRVGGVTGIASSGDIYVLFPTGKYIINPMWLEVLCK